MVNFFGGGVLGYTGSPLRKFSGVISKREMEPGQQGRNDRIKLHFVGIEIQHAIVKYEYKTTILDIPAPTSRQMESAHGVPPRTQLGILLKSLDDVFGEPVLDANGSPTGEIRGTSIDKLILDKVSLNMQATERRVPQRTRNEETGVYEETGEFTEFLEWRCVGSNSTKAIDPIDILLGLIPESGATGSDIASIYMDSTIRGKLDDELFNGGLLDKLVGKGKLTLDENKLYHNK